MTVQFLNIRIDDEKANFQGSPTPSVADAVDAAVELSVPYLPVGGGACRNVSE
jgi:hypothetical protein